MVNDEKDVELSIIIISYNTADQIGACLSSIAEAACCPSEIIVVDNASKDDGPEFIRNNHPDVHLIVNAANRGFAAANNQALAQSRGRYVLFLNPDTLVRPYALEELLKYMEENPQVGLAGPRIVNPDGSLQESVSYRYPGARYARKELSGLKGAIACILGAAMIARRECIEKLAGFDEDFFLYGEDQDLCLRLRKTGYEIGYTDRSVVMHVGGQSERSVTSAEIWQKKIRAEYLFYRKHYLPETLATISRIELVKARYRIAMLSLALPFLKHKDRARDKLRRYQVLHREVTGLSTVRLVN